MTVRVGIIGVGIMGADHARTLVTQVPGATLQSVYDADTARARAVAEETGAASVGSDPLGVVNDPAVDAVLIASPDKTHRELTLACLAARKPVLCEKPLAPTARECLEIVDAETRLGKKLVQVGYMRRFDPSYVEMKAAWQSGRFGKPLMFHCVHRNVLAPSWFDSSMAIGNSAVHEFDIARFVLDAELSRISVFKPSAAAADEPGAPVFLVLESSTGQLVNIEVFISATYGYDVRGELVCEKGTVALRAPVNTEASLDLSQGIAYPADWRPRFAAAYRLQNQAWIKAIGKGGSAGASAWDGYTACAVAEAGVASLNAGGPANITLADKPALYA
jgi:myo-inositol 2-dehydrogenase / D-chiro-inositol 1-dehydrogenase